MFFGKKKKVIIKITNNKSAFYKTIPNRPPSHPLSKGLGQDCQNHDYTILRYELKLYSSQNPNSMESKWVWDLAWSCVESQPKVTRGRVTRTFLPWTKEK